MKRIMFAAAAACAALALGACNGDNAPKQGGIQVVLTDAPFPFDSVARADVWVVRVDAKLAETDSAGAEQGKNSDEIGHDPASEWVTIARPDAPYELLSLQGGKTVDLGQAALPAGSYRGFRLVLDTDRSSVTLKDGTVLTGASNPGIKWPSAGRSGVKINLDQPVVVNADVPRLVIDFDLGKSFVLRGNTISKNGLLFKPVVRATAVEINGSVAGEVRAGTAGGALVPDAAVELLKAGSGLGNTDESRVLGTTKSDANGKYKFGFVLPGTYALRATPPSGSPNAPGYVDNVTVGTREDVTGRTIVVP